MSWLAESPTLDLPGRWYDMQSEMDYLNSLFLLSFQQYNIKNSYEQNLNPAFAGVLRHPRLAGEGR